MFFDGKKKDDCDTITKMMDSSNINGSSDELPHLDSQPKDSPGSTSKADEETNVDSSESQRKLSRKRAAEDSWPQHPKKQIRTRSLSKNNGKQFKRDEFGCREHSRKSTKSSRRKGYQLRKVKSPGRSASLDNDIEVLEDSNLSDRSRESTQKLKCERKKMKARQQMKKKNENALSPANRENSLKGISSKRKSDHPKRYMPSKQGKLSETIIAKQLRNRILFDTTGSLSDEDALNGGVPEELYDALMKCHLEDQSKRDKRATLLGSTTSSLFSTEPRRLKSEDLLLDQRLLTFDDGLFYAGCIRDIQGTRYGIMLDGRRGNRLQFYSQEELLTQAIVESKPLSSELPVGTRVCAFWSRDYWCMYPGVVGEASCPSHDWSEPRVFVLFDDGDTAQIATKNIRLIPPEIIPTENDCDDPAEQTPNSCDSEENGSKSQQCSTSKTLSVKDCDISIENESKDSSCASVNDSSCDDSCFNEFPLSPSQNPESCTRSENNTSGSYSNDTDTNKLEKRQKKRSKRKTGSRTKFKEDPKDKSESKLKRHKKNKEKHHKHHHHHHHHHRHHHHHHHSKKHKHKRKNEKNGTSQNSDKGVIPFGVNHKSCKIYQTNAEACTNQLEQAFQHCQSTSE